MGSQEPAAISFYEASPWEQEYFSQQLPGHRLLFSERPLGAESLAEAEEAAALSIFIRSRITSSVLERLPQLRFVATRSTGYDHIDVAACAARGIQVANVPRYGENTVAEHTFGLILALSRHIHQAWQKTARGDFSLGDLRGFDLKEKTLGVVGTGDIGLHVIRIATGFGMEVVAYDVRQNHLVAEVLGFRYAPLEEVLAAADVLTLHVPGTPQTHHLIDREAIQQMKRGALLINTARGTVVDTQALLWGLDQGIIGGAGLDVVEGEELVSEESALLAEPETTAEKLRLLLSSHALLRRDNVLITPHCAFYSNEALQRIAGTTVSNLHSFFKGEPQNLVSPDEAGRRP